jgi:hypothetical protein
LEPELKACAVQLIPIKSLVNPELSTSQYVNKSPQFVTTP